jgi:hypothetical protein
MMWVRTVSWVSKLSFAEGMKHFRKEVVPTLKDSPASSIKHVQTGPNSGLIILEFDSKRALNQHEKMVAGLRKPVAKETQSRLKVVDGPVKWRR